MKFMDENASSFSPSYSQSQSPKIYINRPAGSGLTLVIPSLKSLKASRDSSTRSSSQGPIFQDVDNQERRPPRPVKLKPLKEVLTKLISQIKKKDDYAFFLHPVDVANVPGYSDVVTRPMDLGTMTDKVTRGKYRSLEDFASDLKLVTNNAKLFNPAGSIYHTEADRLETWALDHISRAAATVIQYETDWNIEIEKDDDGAPVNVDEDDDDARATPMDVDPAGTAARERSVSSQPQPGPSRRGPRGPYKKHAPPTGLSETLEPEGGLPGSKDGLGAFPPGSDWARTMVALKRKGKKYRTKKERLRFERDGPPLLADGSLDYTEMEDPFSVLSAFVPDPPSRPHLVPLFPPLYNPPTDPSSSQNQTPLPSAPISTFPAATALPLEHAAPALPFLENLTPVAVDGTTKRRRHWTITRNPTWRNKGKERDDDPSALAPELPPWRMPRPAGATDFGSFALLGGALAEEMRVRGIATTGRERETWDHEVTAVLLRERLRCTPRLPPVPAVEEGDVYWSKQRAAEAEDYVRDVVYGGAEGLAYVRSLAEFVDGNCYYKEEEPMEQDVIDTKEESSTELPTQDPSTEAHTLGLGMSLAEWVVTNIIDPLTDGQHSLLRDTATALAAQSPLSATQPYSPSAPGADPRKGTVASQVDASLHLFPAVADALKALRAVRSQKIDMGALIHAPTELFLSEEEWIGKALKEKRKAAMLAKLQAEIAGSTGSVAAAAIPASTGTSEGSADGLSNAPTSFPIPAGLDPVALKERLSGRLSAYEQEGPAELNEVLEHVAGLIVELDRRVRERTDSAAPTPNGQAVVNGEQACVDVTMKTEDPAAAPAAGAPMQEDAALRSLRLNLLALAKRAPLDTIARLPKDLVPEHIRHFVPTLGSTG